MQLKLLPTYKGQLQIRLMQIPEKNITTGRLQTAKTTRAKARCAPRKQLTK